MRTVEVPREEWPRALDQFTAIHQGWVVSLDVLGSDIGAQPEITGLPLIGVTADPHREPGNITISAARAANEHVTHIIEAPEHLYIERTDEGADAALEIEARDGTKNILRFRATALPETVNGR
jgi:hypothetical protein